MTQLGLNVIAPVFLCTFAGNYIDSRFGTKTVVPFLIVGILADSRCAYMLVKKMIATEARDDKKARAEMLKEVKEHPVPTVVRPKQPSRVRTSRDETDRENGDV